MNLVKLTRRELKEHHAEDYPEETIVAVANYRIAVKYGNYKERALCTTVYKADNWQDIPLHSLPYYILDFI